MPRRRKKTDPQLPLQRRRHTLPLAAAVRVMERIRADWPDILVERPPMTRYAEAISSRLDIQVTASNLKTVLGALADSDPAFVWPSASAVVSRNRVTTNTAICTVIREVRRLADDLGQELSPEFRQLALDLANASPMLRGSLDPVRK